MIDLVNKFPALEEKLFELLDGLSEEEWLAQTVAKKWVVKDVVAHLYDGNIRTLSGLRDGHKPEPPVIESYQDLLDFLNQLNADWVLAMKRVSPQMLVEFLKHTSRPFCEYYASLDLNAKAEFSVAWAGEMESKNWMHIAREYTEKFLHQQQIRDAVGKQGIINEEFFVPFLEVCMYALPHTLRETSTTSGHSIQLSITGEINKDWYVVFDGQKWNLTLTPKDIVTIIEIDAYASWKLFSKSLRPVDLEEKISITGNKDLGKVAIEMVSFMA
ncbi:maleylpyruvate isomerase N-terminal domain-containing protein [Flammeovirga sp. SubArs3]|uniref:maleylpyruvate isomerase N-terminal domain-containing protein n=1 Tax=Flammeovirga sp. SubArs3 TaxID=2995316 RepID=UPI00248BA23B|nr:maleylpyruvate isomerase N-terminal domain-containing protein [Flammeovirga sp. SubArs3]